MQGQEGGGGVGIETTRRAPFTPPRPLLHTSSLHTSRAQAFFLLLLSVGLSILVHSGFRWVAPHSFQSGHPDSKGTGCIAFAPPGSWLVCPLSR